MRSSLFAAVAILVLNLAPANASAQQMASRPEWSWGAEVKGDWDVLEGKSFRLWHSNKELSEAVLEQAEAAKLSIETEWHLPSVRWEPLCDIYLCSNVLLVSEGGRFGESPAGHALVIKEGRRVFRRRIVLNATDSRLLRGVISHEVSHVVIGSCYSTGEAARWADEAIAMLNEPADRQAIYRESVASRLEDDGTVASEEILMSESRPRGNVTQDFYTRAFAIASFLIQERGRDSFLEFMKATEAGNSLSSLRAIYGIETFSHLDAAISIRHDERGSDVQALAQ